MIQRATHRVARILLCASAAFAPCWSGAQAPTLPDSLTSREFWQFFTTMSEESGVFPSENFVSNEKMYQHVIPTLQRALTPNGVYLGVGPEQNFTYIVNLKPRLAVIVDIRRQNAMTHLMYKALFELSASRAEFVARLFSRPLPKTLGRSATAEEIFAAANAGTESDSAFQANWTAIAYRLTVTHGFELSESDLASIRHVLEAFAEAGPGISYAYHLGAPPTATAWLVTYAELQSATNADGVDMAFLATEENYRWMRTLEQRNMVVPVVGDFGGPKALRAVGAYLAQHGAVVTAFYLSNVEQYLFTGAGADQRFYRSVETLPIDSTSTFIRSLPAPGPPPVAMPILASGSYQSVQIVDSAGVRVVRAMVADSSGQMTPMRFVLPAAPPVTSATGAFVSGISSMRTTLDAFAAGRLANYGQLSALTKAEGWKLLPP